MKVAFLLALAALIVTTVYGRPARQIYKISPFFSHGRVAAFPYHRGKTLLYYYHLGYGHVRPEFNCAHARCFLKWHIINKYTRVVLGFGYYCILNGRNGLFTAEANHGPYIHGKTYMEVQLRNGYGTLRHGYIYPATLGDEEAKQDNKADLNLLKEDEQESVLKDISQDSTGSLKGLAVVSKTEGKLMNDDDADAETDDQLELPNVMIAEVEKNVNAEKEKEGKKKND